MIIINDPAVGKSIHYRMIRIVNEVYLLVPLASLCAEVVSTGNLTEKIVSAVGVASGWWIVRETRLLIPEIITRGCLIGLQSLSKVHDGLWAHILQVVIFGEV